MPGRTVLSNCCEEWILRWGKYYKSEEEFMCLPCGHPWRKGRYLVFTDLRPSPPITYKRVVDGLGFEHLEPEGAPAPLLNRCCSMILIEHGPQIAQRQLPMQFVCPVCDISWGIAQSVGPDLLDVRLYTDKSTERTFRFKSEGVLPFLEPVVQDALVT